MGQEAYAMFPALAEMQARSQLMKAQAAATTGGFGIDQQKFQQGNDAASAFGRMFTQGGLPGAQPGPVPQAPAPGQVSVPMNPYASGGAPAPGARMGGMGQGGGVRVPQPTPPPAMGGMVATGGTPAGTEDQLTQPGDSGAPAVPPPAAVPAQPGTPHKWTAAPGEQNNTPDGSRPRSLDDVMGALKKANPKADPATLARAAALYMPWMTEEDQTRLREETLKTNTLIAEGNRDTRRAIVQEQQDAQTARTNAGIASKEKIAYANMGLREKLAAARQDERYADLTAKQDYWAKKIDIAQKLVDQGTNKLAQKALTEAQRAKHDAVYNLVSTMFSNGDMTSEEKAAIQAQADQELQDAQAMSAPASGAPAKGVPAKLRTQKEEQPLKVPGATGAFPDPGGASSFR